MVRPSLQAMSPNHGIWPEPVDLEAVDVVDRPDLLRVELDHRVVKAVVAGDHRADHAGVLGAFGRHRAPGPPQWAEVKPIRLPRLSLPIVVSVHSVSPVDDETRTAAQRDGRVGVSDAGSRRTSAARATIAAETIRQRPLVLKCPPSIDVPRPTKRTQAVYRRPGSFSRTPHGNMNRD